MRGIALIGSPREPEVNRLTVCLEQLGHFPLIIDTAAFPRRSHLTFAKSGWQYEGQELSQIKSVFLRSLHCNKLAENFSSESPSKATLEALREKDSLLGSLLGWLEARNKHILNPLHTLFCHYYKIHTLERLQDANIPVPATIATNDPRAVEKFAEEYKSLIYKPLAGGAEATALSFDNLSSQLLTRLQSIPVLLQQRIYGYDVRAYILEDQVIAAASLGTQHVDFRSGEQNFQPTTLTKAETADLVKTSKLLSLRFSSIDFKRSANGDYFILDVNTAPMFAGFENITGLRISEFLAKYLVNVLSLLPRLPFGIAFIY
jgi:hypothetical protein